ncbi:MAG TPA: glycosyltransferase [Tepidisphaeraceae bacterium]|jgi:glycosyltransferase involved in cell wall biosynthesis
MTGQANSPPLVTAIVLCYNHARFVVEALEGVKSQTYTNIQLLIIDDRSTDDSVAVIEKWIAANNLDCTFVRHEKNMGLCRSLNEAVSLSRGEYISLVAADDVWLPHKIAMQVEMLEKLPRKVGVAYTDAFQIDEHGNVLPKRFIEDHRRSLTSPPTGDVQEQLWRGNFVPAMSTLVRSEVYKTIGGYDETLAYEDWDFWLRASRQYEFAYSPEISAKYRVLATSMIRTRQDEIRKSVRRIYLKNLEAGDLPPAIQRTAIDVLMDEAARSRHSGDIDYRGLLARAKDVRGMDRLARTAARISFALPTGLSPACDALWRWTFGRRYFRSQRKKAKI